MEILYMLKQSLKTMKNKMKATLIKRDNRWEGVHYILKDEKDWIKASTLSKEKGLSLSLKNCQAIERGYDLDELLKKEIANGKLHPNDGAKKEGIERGIQIALEIFGYKKFSEEDVISIVEKSRETGLTAEYIILTKQQTEWDVEIERSKFIADKSLRNNIKNGFNYTPRLDADGCLILKRI